MTAVCQALGLARSNVHVLRSRLASWVDGRTARTPHGDNQLLADIRAQITELPATATGAPVRSSIANAPALVRCV